jgi:hypothetical protein
MTVSPSRFLLRSDVMTYLRSFAVLYFEDAELTYRRGAAVDTRMRPPSNDNDLAHIEVEYGADTAPRRQQLGLAAHAARPEHCKHQEHDLV